MNCRSSSVLTILKTKKRSDVVLCDVVKFELYYGAYKSQRREKNLELLSEFFNEFYSLPFDGNAGRIAGMIRASLEMKGRSIGTYDLQIAAIALANNLILVTHNTREFSRVEDLMIEDWETEL
jgi:tRNA(fMet)-specific endonuclease VapC